MNSKESLENIVINFDNMGMICSNLGYEEFYAKDLHFKEIFKTEYESILKGLDRLNKLEKENQELKNTILSLELDTCISELRKENIKLKNIIKILDREFIFKITDITNIVYIGCEYSKGKLTKEEYGLLKEVLEND